MRSGSPQPLTVLCLLGVRVASIKAGADSEYRCELRLSLDIITMRFVVPLFALLAVVFSTSAALIARQSLPSMFPCSVRFHIITHDPFF